MRHQPMAAAGAGVLFAIYAASMTISLPFAQQFHYSVILLCAAMFALATQPTPVARQPVSRAVAA